MVFFDDLLSADNFTLAVSRFAHEFREKYDLPQLHQLGIVVPDVEAAAATLEERGMSPFFIASGSPVFWNERGQDGQFTGKLGIAYHKGVEIELLEPGVGSSFYKACVDPDCSMVVQHLGFLVKDVDAWADRLSREGYPVWVRGTIRAIPSTSEFAYMDTVEETGFVIELICWKILGIPFTPPSGLFKALGRIEKTIGIRCLPM